MGASLFLGLASVGLGFVQSQQQKAAIDAQVREQQRQAQAEIEELERQREEARKQAREQKSDRVREADKQMASMLVALGEIGGAGTINERRFAAEIGFNEGLDLARIESNRRNRVDSLAASQTAAARRARSAVDIGRRQKQGTTLRFLGGALGVASERFDRSRQLERTRQDNTP